MKGHGTNTRNDEGDCDPMGHAIIYIILCALAWIFMEDWVSFKFIVATWLIIGLIHGIYIVRKK